MRYDLNNFLRTAWLMSFVLLLSLALQGVTPRISSTFLLISVSPSDSLKPPWVVLGVLGDQLLSRVSPEDALGAPAPDFREALRSEGSGRSATQGHPRDSAFTNVLSSLARPFPKLTPISGRFSKVPSFLGSVPQFCRDRVMRPATLLAQLRSEPLGFWLYD